MLLRYENRGLRHDRQRRGILCKIVQRLDDGVENLSGARATTRRGAQVAYRTTANDRSRLVRMGAKCISQRGARTACMGPLPVAARCSFLGLFRLLATSAERLFRHRFQTAYRRLADRCISDRGFIHGLSGHRADLWLFSLSCNSPQSKTKLRSPHCPACQGCADATAVLAPLRSDGTTWTPPAQEMVRGRRADPR